MWTVCLVQFKISVLLVRYTQANAFRYAFLQVIEVIRTDKEYAGEWQTIGSTKALVRRTAIGIIMALGPYNYPLNEVRLFLSCLLRFVT